MDLSVDIILVKSDAAIFLTFPVLVDGVMFFEDGDEVIGVFLSDVFDAKIVNY